MTKSQSKLSKHKLPGYEVDLKKPKHKTSKHKQKEQAKLKNKAYREYAKSKKQHIDSIKRLRSDIYRCWRDIKKHKLLIKQAKITYKLNK